MFGVEVEWVAVCPEVEVGMGTPREPIRLEARRDGVPSLGERVRLLGTESGRDWTEPMHAWARSRVEALRALELAGVILKASSPSCGPTGVRVAREGTEARTGRGLFAEVLMSAMPDVPVVDEEQLRDPAVRARFVARVLSR
jgi:uncharacterized protein YbbK (DUF523 family)